MNQGVSSSEQGRADDPVEGQQAEKEREVIDVADVEQRPNGEPRSSVLVFRDRQALVRRSLGRAAEDSIPQFGADKERVDARTRPTIGKTAGVAGRRVHL